VGLPLRLIVFGATGATGRQVIDRALAAGHVVTAFARDTAFEHEGVKVIHGNVLDQPGVTAAIRGHDAVFSGLGTKPWKHEDICSQGTRVIAAGMKEAGVKRIVVISSQGVGDSSVGTFAKPFVSLFLGKSFRDKAVMEDELAATDLEWTIVRPGMLTNGKSRGTWRAGEHGELAGGMISRADVAAFTLRELADNTWLRKRPSVAW
jgi:putative NADH-flavin reductase